METLSSPVIWSDGDRCSIPTHPYAVYIMGYDSGNCSDSLYRVGAHGIRSPPNKSGAPRGTIKKRTVETRIKDCQPDWIDSGKLNLIFVFAVCDDWYEHLSDMEYYLQGEMYRLGTFVGRSHFRCGNREGVLQKARESMTELAENMKLLERIAHSKKSRLKLQ